MYKIRIISLLTCVLMLAVMICTAVSCDSNPQSDKDTQTSDTSAVVDSTFDSASEEYTDTTDIVDTDNIGEDTAEDTTNELASDTVQTDTTAPETTVSTTEAATTTEPETTEEISTSIPVIPVPPTTTAPETTEAATTTEPVTTEAATTTAPVTTEAATTTAPETTEAATTTESATTEAATTTTPETNAPTGPSKILTYEEYMAMTTKERQAYYEEFASAKDFNAWYREAKAVYDAEQEKNEIEDGDNVDIGDVLGKN